MFPFSFFLMFIPISLIRANQSLRQSRLLGWRGDGLTGDLFQPVDEFDGFPHLVSEDCRRFQVHHQCG